MPWIWIGAGLAIAFIALVALSIASYRSTVRKEFRAYLDSDHPEVKVVSQTSKAIELEMESGAIATLPWMRIYSDLAKQKITDPEGRRSLFMQILQGMNEGQSALTIGASDRERLMPRLLVSSELDRFGGQVPALPLVDGLSIVLVFDSPNSVAFVTHENLQELGLDANAALAIAKTNLGKNFSPQMVREAMSGSIVAVKFFDSYDAARLLLLPDHLGEGETLAAAVPDRDTLFITSAPADGNWSAMRKLAVNAADTPLWTEPFVVTRDGIQAAG